MRTVNEIDSRDIKLGMRFSAPVFFDDGENMFLAEEKTVKQYHLVAIERWHIKILLTFGHILSDDEIENSEEILAEEVGDEIPELEELEEIEDAEELEEISS